MARAEGADGGPAVCANARILTDPTTGVQRYLGEILRRWPVETVAPKEPLHGLKGHAWEQFALPLQLGGRLLWSPSNTGPLAVRKQVVTIHDMNFFDRPGTQAAVFQRWYRNLVPRLARRVRCVLTVSEFSKERIIHWSRAPPERIRVVPNGVDHGRFRPDGPAKAPALESLRGAPFLVTVGTLEARKNVPALVAAWSRLSSRFPGHRLVVVGGAGKKAVAQDAVQAGEGTVLTGRLSDDDLAALYRGAELAVFPSTYEGFGLPVLEAMASGCPVLCNGIPAFREVAGDAAATVDATDEARLADGVAALLDDPARRRTMRADGIRRASGYSWDRCARETRAVLEEFA